jgi:hypothetical protein
MLQHKIYTQLININSGDPPEQHVGDLWISYSAAVKIPHRELTANDMPEIGCRLGRFYTIRRSVSIKVSEYKHYLRVVFKKIFFAFLFFSLQTGKEKPD